jgi:hypothetical protein
MSVEEEARKAKLAAAKKRVWVFVLKTRIFLLSDVFTDTYAKPYS